MTGEKKNVLGLSRLPARLDVLQTSSLLGFSEPDVPVLVKARLLRPLGNPTPNAAKFFAACEVEKLASDPGWLGRATRAVARHWQNKNSRGRASHCSDTRKAG